MRFTKVVPTLVLGGIATVALGAFVPGGAFAQEADPGLSRLLNKANTINYEEIEMGKLAQDRAGDNQAMLTLAKTIKGDHQANEDAVTALSRMKNVKIEGTPASVDTKYKHMEDLKGAQFNEAFLKDAVEGHAEALKFFEAERSKFRGDPDVNLYVEQTIPVIRAHLEMARNMKQELRHNSREKPENNKRASSR